MWGEITDPFAAIEILEWIRNFIPQFTGNVIAYIGIKINPS